MKPRIPIDGLEHERAPIVLDPLTAKLLAVTLVASGITTGIWLSLLLRWLAAAL